MPFLRAQPATLAGVNPEKILPEIIFLRLGAPFDAFFYRGPDLAVGRTREEPICGTY
jgi:hypothetical protein